MMKGKEREREGKERKGKERERKGKGRGREGEGKGRDGKGKGREGKLFLYACNRKGEDGKSGKRKQRPVTTDPLLP